MLGAVFGGEGREEEDVEEVEDEPEEEEEEVTLSAALATLTVALFNSPTLRTSVSSRPAYLTQYQVTSATYSAEQNIRPLILNASSVLVNYLSFR